MPTGAVVRRAVFVNDTPKPFQPALTCRPIGEVLGREHLVDDQPIRQFRGYAR
jgi:hypothetical protein